MRRGLPTLAYLAAGIPLGIVWFTLLVTGFAMGLGMLVTVVGVFVLAATWEAARLATGLESHLARTLLGASTAPVERVGGLLPKVRSAEGWRGMGFLLSRFVLGIPLGSVVAGLVLNGIALVVGPLWFWAIPDGIEFGIWNVDSLGEEFLAMPLGAVVAAFGLWLATQLEAPLRALAEWGMPAEARILRPAGHGGARRLVRREPKPVDWNAALRGVMRVAGGVLAVELIVWAATGTGYAWWVWSALGLAIPVGFCAVGVLKERFGVGRARNLAVHAGLAGVLVAVMVGCWAMSGFGYFWPAWVAAGLAIPLTLHALMPAAASRELKERLERVEASRAAGVDARDDELGRIERDLHDGAQARLVAVAMGLGRAEERMEADPERARELMLEAQEHARAAIKELRDLARGIAPPVLADRGLVAAVKALAATSPLDVVVRDDLGRTRPPAPIERTAYFVVAEALTNAAKHVGPEATVIVDLDRGKHRLHVRVLDDGPGGAAAAGSGIRGLAQRVEAVDGAFEIESEPGAGTLIRASLPWAGATAGK